MDYIIWSKPNCPACVQAKKMISSTNASIEERLIGSHWTKEDLLQLVPNARTVPQIFHGENLIGGILDLTKHLQETYAN
jgi:glutaredoxin 3